MRINLLKFYGSKVKEDPHGFTDEDYKVHEIMGVFSIEKSELAAYHLKYVSKFGMSNRKIRDH